MARTFTKEELESIGAEPAKTTEVSNALSLEEMNALMGEKEVEEPSTFLGGVKEAGSKLMERTGEREQRDVDTGQSRFSSFLQQAGAGGQFVGELAFEGIKTAGRGLGSLVDRFKPGATEELKRTGAELAGGLAETRVGEQAVEVVQTGAELWTELEEQYPTATANIIGVAGIAEGAFTLVEAAQFAKGFKGFADDAVKATGAIGQETINIADDVVDVVKRVNQLKHSETGISNSLQEMIKKPFAKGVKPRFVGANKTPQAINRYYDDATDAVVAINRNKDNLQYIDDVGEIVTGQNPKTIKQLSDALTQTKSKIFAQYDDLAKQATGQGVTMQVDDIADQLRIIADDDTIKAFHKGVSKYADEMAEEVSRLGAMSPDDAQKSLKLLNEKLNAFYKNPNAEQFSKNYVDSLIANNLRSKLDDTITGAVGGEYAGLKKQYSALKTIEGDITHRMVVEARKANKGLIDYTDIFSGGDAVTGLIAGQPELIAKGAVQKGIKDWYKRINSPDRAISSMFDDVDDAIRLTQPIAPKSATGQTIKSFVDNPTLGLSLQDISENKELIKLFIQRESAKTFAAKQQIDDKIKSITDDLIERFDDTPNKQGGFTRIPGLGKENIGGLDAKIGNVSDEIKNLENALIHMEKGDMLYTTKINAIKQKQKVLSELKTLKKASGAKTPITNTALIDGDNVVYRGDDYTFVRNRGIKGDQALLKSADNVEISVPLDTVTKSTKKLPLTKSYGMGHRPSKAGSGFDLTNADAIPADIYTHPHFYANMDDITYKQSYSAILDMKGKPNKVVTIYRASPENKLNDGDWVTLSKAYAKQESLLEKTPVHSFRVKAKDIQFAGDDINEFGYFPKD